MLGICADPFTPKIDLPATILPATRSESPAMVCAPVRYVPAAIVWFEVPGVIVAAALVVTDAVRLTDVLPAVPDATYPADTCGVLDTLLVRVSVFVPVVTDALVPDMDDAGVADPEATVPLALLA